MNYYPHHIGDYAKDASHLKMLEDGAYRRMMDIYYSTERPLPLDRPALYRVVRAQSKAERSAVDAVLKEFFLEKVDGWHNKRCDEEIDKAKDKSQKTSDSARKRWSERNANVDTNAMRTHSDGTAKAMLPITNNQEPITSTTPIVPSKSNSKHPPRKKGPLPDGFGISERVANWCTEHQIENAEKHLEYFIGYVTANGKTYANWDQALINCIRGNWSGAGHGRRELAI